MNDFNIFDLKDIDPGTVEDLDKYTMPCIVCGEQVPQTVDECPCCGTPVVWKGSRVWRWEFGSATKAIRRLTAPVPDDDDLLGRRLVDQLGKTGFANTSQKKRWDKARRNISEDRLKEMIARVLEKSNKRGALPHLLNWTDKIIRENKPKPKKTAPKGVPRVPTMPGE